MATLTINAERLWDSLITMVQIGVTPRGGVCRLAFTNVDRQGRDLFVRWASEAGCTVYIDQMGNNIAQRAGLDNSLPPGIQGLRWFDCTIYGLESHAGTTSIPTRRDAPYTHCRRPCVC